MSVQRVMVGSPGLDLVGMINAHVGLHNQRDVNKAQEQASAGQRPESSIPLSAALPHPTRRPSFLKTAGARGSGKGARRGESRIHLARHDHGDEAELPGWQRMEPGDRLEGPIAGEAETSLATDRMRRQHLVQQDTGARAANQPPDPRSGVSGALENMASLARRAVLDRQRACSWLFASFPAVA